jgi:hypothetical protein
MQSPAIHAVFPFARWGIVLVRIALVLAFAGELYVTGAIQRVDLMHPTAIGTDSSTYFSAGQRLNAGHPLYGPLVVTDRPIPGYPKKYPAPLLSPPLVAVIWRPLAALGDVSMTIWWAANLALVTLLAAFFAAVGRRWTLGGLLVILALGWPLVALLRVPYLYPGYQSPISTTALSGNLDGYLTGLCVLAWWASTRGRSRLAGAVAGLAAVLKLGPFVLAWWLVVRRDWPAVKAFVVTVAILGIVGLLGAGLDANLAYLRLALGAAVTPTPLSIPWILHTLLGLPQHVANLGTIAGTIVGLGVVYATRRHARLSFLVTILVIIYCSPVVMVGNFALLLAAVTPWAMPVRPGQAVRPGPGAVGASGRVSVRASGRGSIRAAG